MTAVVSRGDGERLAPDVRGALAPRFGFDLDVVRVHHGPAAAETARARGALAYTWGHDVVFGPSAYQPHSAPGQALLAHELTHVGQYLSGDQGAESTQERQADAVESGGAFRASPATSAPSRPQLRLRSRRAVGVTMALSPKGGAGFTAELEGGGSVTGSGTAIALKPGEYTVFSQGANLVVRTADGEKLPAGQYFNIPPGPGNQALNEALANATAAIPLHVQEGPVVFGGGGQPSEETANDAARKKLMAMPQHIRDFLLAPDDGKGKKKPIDYVSLLRIAEAVADLTPEELAEYGARTTGGTTSLAAFEASVNRWLAQLERRHMAEAEQEEASRALVGLDGVYEMYRSWSSPGAPKDPAAVARWEGLPASALTDVPAGDLPQLYVTMRQALEPLGYPNLAAFEAAIQRFVNAFRESSVFVGAELLDRLEHTLLEQQPRYAGTGGATAALHTSLAPARETFEKADEYRKAALAQHNNPLDPSAISAGMAAGEDYKRQIAEGRGQVAAQAGEHPLLASGNFPLEQLGRSDAAGVQQTMSSYITTSLEGVRNTRDRLHDNKEIVFKLPKLVATTKARQGITAGSIWDKIIQDHQAPTVAEVAAEALELAATIILMALSMAGTGGASVAVASAAMSSYQAVRQYEDYAFRSDAYGAQFLAEEPSLFWVVVAITGAGVELAAVSKVLGAVRSSVKTFQSTGDLAALQRELDGIPELLANPKVRQAILAEAKREAEAIKRWEGLIQIPKDVMRGSALGLDWAINQTAKLAYSAWRHARRGIASFNRWKLTREAASLVGDVNKLSPKDVQRLAKAYAQAAADGKRIAKHGKSLGLSDTQVDDVLEGWARRGTGTADEVMQEMTATHGAAKTRLPRSDGAWDGDVGNSEWVSHNLEVNRVTGSQAVPFRKGEPVLKKWAKERVVLKEMTGLDTPDFRAARDGLMRQHPGRWKNVTHVEEWEKGKAADNFGKALSEQHTWHHEPDLETMSLVPTALHANVPHIGGASPARGGAGPSRSTAPFDADPL